VEDKPSFAQDIEERFVRYVRIDTTSDEGSSEVPSTSRQLDLQKLLETELRNMGASDVTLTSSGYVLATIPATVDGEVPTVALLAHVDTVQAYSGSGVRPIVHRNYDGAPIVLPDDPTKILDPKAIPLLKEKIGHTLITASGTTLLGGDDKSGVAVIMALAKHLLAHTEIPHGRVRLCFTPDEEIGRGVEHIELAELGADVAYTLDGGSPGEVTFETFSADKAVVTIDGVSIHPGTAKDAMVNAIGLAARLLDFLPAYARTPETTDDREGFIHATRIGGNAARTQIHFILRDFEREGLAAHGRALTAACDALQALDPRATVSCEITPQYRNMRYWLERDMRPVEKANEAIRRAGLTPASRPARGGTDGSRLTERGLPTPNLFTGMYNVHGPLEWASVEDMETAAQVCLHLVEIWAEPPAPAR
jgi:tripeptide aminopeptidase